MKSHQSGKFSLTDLVGEESFDVEDVGIGLDGAENIGQVSGDVGLGFSKLTKEKKTCYK